MTTIEEKEAVRREAQLVADTLHGGISVYGKTCWQCSKRFVTSADYINLCSDRCVIEFMNGLGIMWYPAATPTNRWEFTPPATIDPSTLAALIEWARKIVKLSGNTSS